jgi:hypothetical protein
MNLIEEVSSLKEQLNKKEKIIQTADELLSALKSVLIILKQASIPSNLNESLENATERAAKIGNEYLKLKDNE